MLIQCVAYRLFREGRFDLAKTQYATALKFLKAQDSPKDDVSKVTALSNIAILDFADGRYEQAKELLGLSNSYILYCLLS